MSDENGDHESVNRHGDDGDENGTDGADPEMFEYANGETSGTDGGDHDERLVGTEPDADAIDEPTTESAQASRATRWGIQQGLAIGLVSIVSGVLIVFGLMQATGLITLPGPLEGSAIAHWTVFVALGVLFAVLFAYSRRGT